MDAVQVIADTVRLPEAAKRLGMPQTTLRGMVADGRLPAVKVGGRLRVYPADIDKLAQPVEPKPKPAPPPPAPPEPPQVPPGFISVREAARRLRVTPRTIRDRLTAGYLRGVHTAGRWWLDPESVAAFTRIHGEGDALRHG
jgi:excisionase family DNA binding protein